MYFDVERIDRILKDLRALVYRKRKRIDDVYYKKGDFNSYEDAEASESEWLKFEQFDIWGDKYSRYWFKAEFIIPEELDGEYVLLELATGKEDQWNAVNPQFLCFLNGKIVQGLDTNHREVILSKNAKAGEGFRSDFHGYGGMSDDKANFNIFLKAFDAVTEKLFYDIKIPLDIAKLLKQEDKRRVDILKHLLRAIELLDLRKPYSEKYYISLNNAIEYLQANFYDKECGKINEGKVVCLGHTHIDVAWLWDLKQTREKAVRSFSTVLNLMREYPDYTFMASQPILYKFVKEKAPEVYDEIRERIKEGRWEAEGAMYLEADCNLTSGESLIRQILFGKQFFREEFGVDSRVLWLPDVFGYSAALPQILRGFEVEYFITSKISWNEYNRLPYDTFMWQGIDGTEILTYFITTNDYDKVLSGNHRTIYEGDISPSQIKGSYERYKPKEMNDEVIMSYGFGDGGGGPTKEMLESYKRLNRGIPGCPKAVTKPALEYFNGLKKRVNKYNRLPKWVGELYLEFHRGTYTTIAKNKKYNRTCEFMYQDIELFSTLAKYVDDSFKYDKKRINENWEMILLNQFHDIIPGTSIKEVYDESWEQYERILENGREMLDNALSVIVKNVSLGSEAIIVFNQLSFERCDYIVLDMASELKDKIIVDTEGKEYAYQFIDDVRAIIHIDKLPAKGYRVFYIKDKKVANPNQNSLITHIDDRYVLENKLIKVIINNNGEIISLYDKRVDREIVKENEKANSLMIYEDKPHNPWEAWDIDIYYSEKAWEITDIISVEILSQGPLRATLKIEKEYEASRITQLIHIYHDSPRIDFETKIDWQEDNVLLRVGFPVDIKGYRATYDIQYGNIERDTHFNTSWDMAKFEVCGHKWADLSEYGYGVALLNDCKYGYNIKDGVIGMTLLKAPRWPNPTADRGEHEFTYSLLPHIGGWKEGRVQEEAYKLNCKPYVFCEKAHVGSLEDKISLITVDADNVIVEVIKEQENGLGTIVRVFESFNKRTRVRLETFITPKRICEVNLEEKELKECSFSGKVLEFEIGPYEIKTFKIE